MRTQLTLLATTIFIVSCGTPDPVSNGAETPANQDAVDQSSIDIAPEGEAVRSIIHGEDCEQDLEPTAVAILVDAEISSFFGTQQMSTVMCTGTLIAPDVVLTAAHCLDSSLLTLGFGEVLSEQYYVSFEPDLTALAEAGQQQQSGPHLFPDDAIEAADWIAHPEFDVNELNQTVNGPGDHKDIGLIFLSEAVKRRPEVVITAAEAEQVVEGAPVTIAGWGQQVPTQGPFDPPPAGSVGRKVCAPSFIGDMGTEEFQVGGDSDTSRKCHGDSGGPTYLVVDTDSIIPRRVIGITSHAYDQTDCAKGGVDTRVDHWLGWIDEHMTDACARGVRSWCEVEGIIPPTYYETSWVEPVETGPEVYADLELRVLTAPEEVTIGETAEIELRLKNTGAVRTQGAVTLVGTLDEGLTFDDLEDDDLDCVETSDGFMCDVDLNLFENDDIEPILTVTIDDAEAGDTLAIEMAAIVVNEAAPADNKLTVRLDVAEGGLFGPGPGGPGGDPGAGLPLVGGCRCASPTSSAPAGGLVAFGAAFVLAGFARRRRR